MLHAISQTSVYSVWTQHGKKKSIKWNATVNKER